MATPFPPFQELTSQDWQNYQLALSPTALLDPTGTLFEAALASAKDYHADRVRLSIKAKLATLAPSDALVQLGIERQMPRGVLESEATYAARLQAAWTAWPFAGTPFGLLSQLYALGYTNARIYTAGSGGPAWGNPQTWSSFSWAGSRGRQFRLSPDGKTLVVTQLPPGSWFIDSQIPSPGITPWAPGTLYPRGVSVMPSPTAWAPASVFPPGSVVTPTATVAQTGLYYQTAAGGISGSAQPSWPTQPGLTFNDNGITWVAIRRDFWFRTALGGTSGTTQPMWTPAFYAATSWNSFSWGNAAAIADNTVKWIAEGSDFWSRFDVLLPSEPPSGQLSPTSDEATLVRNVVRQWRPASTTNNRITIVTGGQVLGTTGTPVWGAFTWSAGPTWNSFNWNAGSYSAGTKYASAGATQLGAAAPVLGGTTTNWSGG